MIELQGDYGEGGGQIVRTALALSALLEKSFTVSNIRLGRDKPGLKAQHLTCISALRELCGAEISGDSLGSTKLSFSPGQYKPKILKLDIGTAGSIPLLLQSLLLPAILAKDKSRFVIKGGTDGKWAMPIDYVKNVFVPQLKRFGTVTVNVEKRGYYPKGGGKVDISVTPKFKDDVAFMPSIDLVSQKNLLCIKGMSHASLDLQNAEVAERQKRAARHYLSKYDVPVKIETVYSDTLSTGSGIVLWALFGDEDVDVLNPIIIGADVLGAKGVKSEIIGQDAAKKLIDEIDSKAAVDVHLADNLIPFLGLFGGRIKVSCVSEHTKTNIYVVEKFLDVKFKIEGNVISVEK